MHMHRWQRRYDFIDSTEYVEGGFVNGGYLASQLILPISLLHSLHQNTMSCTQLSSFSSFLSSSTSHFSPTPRQYFPLSFSLFFHEIIGYVFIVMVVMLLLLFLVVSWRYTAALFRLFYVLILLCCSFLCLRQTEVFSLCCFMIGSYLFQGSCLLKRVMILRAQFQEIQNSHQNHPR